MRSWIVEATGGQAVVQSELLAMRPLDKMKRIAKERNGVIVLICCEHSRESSA